MTAPRRSGSIFSALLFLWMSPPLLSASETVAATATATASSSEGSVAGPETRFVRLATSEEESPLLEFLREPHEGEEKHASSLRGGIVSGDNTDIDNDIDSHRTNNNRIGTQLPPIPPLHPKHTGTVQYSSVMDAHGTVTYRRDFHAPCDNGMLVFNVGPSMDDLPYHYDLYGDAYLWSDNGGLCILYPTYDGYQLSNYGPFWRPGFDPTTVRFDNLIADPNYMHRISSRILEPAKGANNHSQQINRNRAGDYIIMGKHNFYGIRFYQKLKEYVNGWGPDGPDGGEIDVTGDEWVVTDAIGGESFEASFPEIQ